MQKETQQETSCTPPVPDTAFADHVGRDVVDCGCFEVGKEMKPGHESGHHRCSTCGLGVVLQPSPREEWYINGPDPLAPVATGDQQLPWCEKCQAPMDCYGSARIEYARFLVFKCAGNDGHRISAYFRYITEREASDLREKAITLFVNHLMTLGFDDYEAGLMRQEHHSLDFDNLPATEEQIDQFHFSLSRFEQWGIVHDLARDGKKFSWRVDREVLARMASASFEFGRA